MWRSRTSWWSTWRNIRQTSFDSGMIHGWYYFRIKLGQNRDFTFWLEIVCRHTCKFSSSNRESNSWIWREVAAAEERDWATPRLKPGTPSLSQVPLQTLPCLLKKGHFLSQESSTVANRVKSGDRPVRTTHLQHQAPGVSLILACSYLFLLMGIWCLVPASPSLPSPHFYFSPASKIFPSLLEYIKPWL